MERSISEARFETDRIRMGWDNRTTFEQSRTCFRRGEDEHAERRGNSGGHSSVNRVQDLLYKQSHMIIDNMFSSVLQN